MEIDEGISYEEFVAKDPHLPEGTRVKIIGDPIAMKLPRKTGIVRGAADYDGYYRVRLDGVGLYFNADGTVDRVRVIIESYDNMRVLPPLIPSS